MDSEKRLLGVRARWVIGVAVAVGALTSPMLGGPAWARPPLVVDDDGQQCAGSAFETIAEALEAAVDGDMIRVCPGVYEDELHVTKSVRIVGPVEAVGQLDCVAIDPAKVAEFADTTRLAVLQPEAPVSTNPDNPLVTLDADGIELAGLVIQGHIDEVSTMDETGTYPFYVPAVSATDAHAGYRLHHNVFRMNTLGVELGSSGDLRTRLDHNCLRDNWWAISNQRMRLDDAVIDVNSVFRTSVIGMEVGWGYRGTDGVTVRENIIRESGYAAMIVENSEATRVVGNDVASASSRGIWVSAGNRDVSVLDNLVEGGTAPPITITGISVSATGVTPAVALPRSEDIAIRGNTVSGTTSYGIAALAGALVGETIADNVTFGNGLNGITLFNNNRDNVVSGNLAYDNGRYGIRVMLTLSTGNLIQRNTMHGNLLADASDASDPTPADGIQLRNTWIENECVTDEPLGLICGNSG